MDANILVLGKYCTKETLSQLANRASADIASNLHVRIIVKDGDEAPEAACIVRHQKNMKGDVCDFLWEAVELDQDLPLILVSARAYAAHPELPTCKRDLAVFCSESGIAGFKFDTDGLLVEAGDLPAHAAFVLIFRCTADFVESAERIILLQKAEASGLFEIKTVINQMILDGKSIETRTVDFEGI